VQVVKVVFLMAEAKLSDEAPSFFSLRQGGHQMLYHFLLVEEEEQVTATFSSLVSLDLE